MSFLSAFFLPFLLVLLLCYYLLPKKVQWLTLLFGSFVFYAFSGWKNLFFLVAIALIAYFGVNRMQKIIDAEAVFFEKVDLDRDIKKQKRAEYRKKRKKILIPTLIFGFGLLAIVKYTGFVASIFDDNTSFGDWLIPLGLSFYVFQSMGYVIDVYYKKVTAERNFWKSLLFASYFPQLIQGPISRYADLSVQLQKEHTFQPDNIKKGLLRFLYGFFKKLVLADTALIAVNTITSDPSRYNGIYVLVLIVLYSVVIYGDFTGGIDIVIGISRMLDITLTENFNAPFSSKSIKEYWKRWHITMGTWFDDYIFKPLSISKPLQKMTDVLTKWFGDGFGNRFPVYFATIVTWFLTGLWHGAGWNFIVWGLLNGILLLISNEFKPLYAKFHKTKLSNSKCFDLFRCVRTFLLVGWIRTLDVYGNVSVAFRAWGSLFTFPSFTFDSLGLNLSQWILIACSVLFVFLISQWKKRGNPYHICDNPVLFITVVCLFISVILIFGCYGIGYDATDFIYRQF